jgi:prephenate dehydratase
MLTTMQSHAQRQATDGLFHSGNEAALRASMVQDRLVDFENAKSSIIFTLRDGPGALGKALQLFHKYNVNMSAIESRPSKGR